MKKYGTPQLKLEDQQGFCKVSSVSLRSCCFEKFAENEGHATEFTCICGNELALVAPQA